MKRTILAAALAISGLSTAASHAQTLTRDDDSLRIAVISDIHIMAPELLEEEGTAYRKYIAGDRKLLKEGPDILRAAVAKIAEGHPDAVFITGDLTKDGEKESHMLNSEELLRPLADKGIKVFVIPGNHDVNNPHAAIFSADTSIRTETVTPEEFASIYSRYGYGAALARDPYSLSYMAQIDSCTRLLAIDACRYGDNDFSTNRSRVDGRIRPETMRFIKEQARKARKDGCRIFTIMHHGLVRHWTWQDLAMSDYLVKGWKKDSRIFGRLGLNVVFTGHFHAQDISTRGRGNHRVYDIETGSAVSHPLPVREVTVAGDSLSISTWHITGLLNDSRLDAKALEYARSVISSVVEDMVPDRIPEEIVKEASGLVAEAYTAHISGDETMPDSYMERLDAAARKVRRYSPKYAFILRHIGRYLYTDTGMEDNNATIHIGR